MGVKMGVNSNFNDDWKEFVENRIENYSNISTTY